MSKRNKYLIIAGLLSIIIIAGAVFLFSWAGTKAPSQSEEDAPVKYNPSGEVTQTIENPEVTDNSNANESNSVNGQPAVSPVPDNTDLAESIQVPDQMQEVIDKNSNNINNQEVVDQLAQSYPSNLIPVFRATTAADSADIITNNGKPGWTAQYGSDATVQEISAFYEDLMKGSSGYKSETSGQSTVINGTVENCNVSITVSPNNPDRTGLDEVSDVSIFIERQ